MKKEILYAYMAGFVDADGSISIVTVAKEKKYIPKITVSNCDYKIIELFSNYFGGKIRKRVWKNKNWRPCYEWTQTCRKAGNIVKHLLPFLIVKKKQAEIVLKAVELKKVTNGGLKRWHLDRWQKIQNELQILKDQCKALNKRGTGL